MANVVTGRLTAAFDTRRVLCSAAVLVAASRAFLLITNDHTGYPWVAIQLTALGFALGVIVPAITSGLLGRVDPSHSGIAAGMHFCSRSP